MLLPRFYPILDTSLLRRRGLSAIEAAVQVLDAGARILQLRHKEFFTGEWLDQAVHIAELCRAAEGGWCRESGRSGESPSQITI
jgi:thiamine monophosphate synthase